MDTLINLYFEILITGNTQNSSQDWYELQKTPREKLKSAMKILSESFEPITSQLTKKWENTSKSARSYYTRKARECIELVLSIMAPCQEDILLEKIQINSTQEIKKDNMTASVMEAFQNSSDSRTQTQILSIIVNNHTKTELQTLIPGLTINKIDSARKHALVSGPGTVLNQPKIYRMKLSKPKVSHFVEFILNPIYSNIVGFGETILKLSSKEKIKVPKVIRNVINARLIETYLSYCKDSGFDTFSRASLYRILNVCHASKQK
ncbi:RNF1_2 [Mytilus coruscus]|uniref:RNF1_2 n=1 Tax=Mytilus coruscus TaxID=42192 RepID=A0A6J8BJN8_MYTCO|nr:RNF1_2 [Mytilus coruscus]